MSTHEPSWQFSSSLQSVFLLQPGRHLPSWHISPPSLQSLFTLHTTGSTGVSTTLRNLPFTVLQMHWMRHLGKFTLNLFLSIIISYFCFDLHLPRSFFSTLSTTISHFFLSLADLSLILLRWFELDLNELVFASKSIVLICSNILL